MKGWFQRFMAGRYGFDQFGGFLCISSLILIVIGAWVSPVLYWLGLAAIVYSYFRILSRNTRKRYSENLKYLSYQNRVTTWFGKQQVRFNFAVILMVANTEDEQGLTAWEKSVDLKKEVFQAILGADDIQAGRDWIQFESLTVLDLNRAALTVQLDFSCQYEINDNETRHGADIDRLGRFLRMYTDIDVIAEKGHPDGRIEAKVLIDLEKTK